MKNPSLRILCVDDDSDIRTIAAMALRLDPDLEVRTASGGEEALTLLRAAGWAPHAILLDVMMPDMDGPDVLRELRKIPAYRQLPVIFMTARARREDVEAYVGLGAVGVIIKPFDPLNIATEVRSLVGSAL